ncbi:hypothetical protein RM550_26225 [Streptomyces sp. DSM 41527]|uniref:Integral membrane protein n=1 Tax=Streptomyces mooreae TaxID=3075523 RepID=A0ABU2TDZ8_9ACTN|nr:hypothetical protein [Streptomyces sp. DSM 41527]MDT0459172.1 hypothetical protein [Streptomyces sp. DSM 41527]
MRLRLRDDAPGLLTIERTGGGGMLSRRLLTLLWVNVLVGFVFVPSAVANPFCSIPFVCEAKKAIDFVSDPWGYLLQQLTETNIGFLRKMLELIQQTTKIDLTSGAFLRQYAIIFAASSLLTAGLWLIAVAKRALRGVSLGTAVSEAVGFLALQFVVNAFVPGTIAMLMRAIDEVTAIFEPYATANFKPFLANLLKILAAEPRDGIGQLITVNLIMLLGALLMWVELLIRGAAIYVAVALGPVINAGLVDKDLWGKSKKWVGAIVAVGISKPTLFALLGLGGAILSDSSGSSSDAVSKILIGALILLLAVFASATLYKWLPTFGDEMAQLHHDRKTASSSGPAAAVDGPALHANRAMSTHLQESLVGGGRPRGGPTAGTARAAGGKGAGSATVGGGTASSKAAAGAGKGAGAAAGGPVGAAAAAAKAGVDVAKNKAANAPGAQWASGAAQHANDGARGAPAAARPQGGSSSGSVVGGSGAPPSPAARPPAPPSGSGAGPSTIPPPQQSSGGPASPIKPATGKDK